MSGKEKDQATAAVFKMGIRGFLGTCSCADLALLYPALSNTIDTS